MIQSDAYPIFDQHVYRAFFYLQKKTLNVIPVNNIKKEKFDEIVKSRSHTKITEHTKKKMDVFKWPFFVPLCLCVKN